MNKFNKTKEQISYIVIELLELTSEYIAKYIREFEFYNSSRKREEDNTLFFMKKIDFQKNIKKINILSNKLHSKCQTSILDFFSREKNEIYFLKSQILHILNNYFFIAEIHNAKERNPYLLEDSISLYNFCVHHKNNIEDRNKNYTKAIFFNN
jgi:hypothetical protein